MLEARVKFKSFTEMKRTFICITFQFLSIIFNERIYIQTLSTVRTFLGNRITPHNNAYSAVEAAHTALLY